MLVLHEFLRRADHGTGVTGILDQFLNPVTVCGVGQVRAIPRKQVVGAVDGSNGYVQRIRRRLLRDRACFNKLLCQIDCRVGYFQNGYRLDPAHASI